MSLFILIFSGIYLLMTLYIYLKVRKPMLVPLFLLGFISPFMMRYADANLSPSVSYLIGFSTLLYMGFLLYLVLSFLLLDLYFLFVKFSHRVFGINPLPKVPKLVAFLLAFSLSAYSHYETLNLEVYHLKLETEKIPMERIRIMHISDVHLGPVMGMDKIKLIQEVYDKYQPDIVVSTGDLVDGNMKRKDGLAHALRKINPPMGKFAVLGNHEYYRGLDQAVDFTQLAGFRLLRGERLDLGYMVLVGVDDSDCRFF
ncbi:metallophosphoesterase, partial [Thermocrinis sp.]